MKMCFRRHAGLDQISQKAGMYNQDGSQGWDIHPSCWGPNIPLTLCDDRLQDEKQQALFSNRSRASSLNFPNPVLQLSQRNPRKAPVSWL